MGAHTLFCMQASAREEKERTRQKSSSMGTNTARATHAPLAPHAPVAVYTDTDTDTDTQTHTYIHTYIVYVYIHTYIHVQHMHNMRHMPLWLFAVSSAVWLVLRFRVQGLGTHLWLFAVSSGVLLVGGVAERDPEAHRIFCVKWNHRSEARTHHTCTRAMSHIGNPMLLPHP